MMQRAVLLAGLMLIGWGGAAAGWAQDSRPGTPKLVLSQESWDFGEVWHLEKPRLTINLRNEGTADLRVQPIQSTCGCAVAHLQRDVLPPGESTYFHLRFDTKGKQRDVEATLIINSNDPQRPTFYFRIKGFVKRAVHIDPDGGLAIRTLAGKAGLTMKVRLENQTTEPMKLKLSGTTLADVLDTELKETNAGLAYELTAWTKKDLPPGIVRGTLRFSTGLEREKTYDVSVRIQVIAALDPSPPVIWLDPAEAAGPSERMVNVFYYGTEQIAIDRVECPLPSVTASAGPVQQASEGMKRMTPPVTSWFQIKVSLPPASALPPEGTKIVFHTNDPQCPKLELPVTTDRALLERGLKGPDPGPLRNVP